MVRPLDTRVTRGEGIPGGRPFRLAIVTSHPVQYHVPLFRLMAAHPAFEVTVFFCSRVGAETWVDPEFEVPIRWDTPLLDGYPHRFLRNVSPRPSVNHVFGLINPGITSALWSSPWDALMVHGYAHLTNWLAIAAARMRGIPILLRGETTLQRPVRGVARIAKRPVLTSLFRQISGFLTIGTENSEFYQTFGVEPQRLFLTPYAVDNEMFFDQAQALAPSRDALRDRLGIRPHEVLLLFSGKLIPRKRPQDLLQAIAQPGLEHAMAGFLGDGVLRRSLEDEASRTAPGRVRFIGFKNQRELAEYYVAADVFVFPSGFETWGLVVNEAMCFGLPVVTTTGVAAARDLVRDGWNGFTHRPGDTDTLTRVLRVLADDPVKRNVMGERSKALIGAWSNTACVSGILEAVKAAARPRVG